MTAAAVPVLAAVGSAIAFEYATNMGIEAIHYLTTRPDDKPFDWSNFANAATGEAADATIADLKNPLTLVSPLHRFDNCLNYLS